MADFVKRAKGAPAGLFAAEAAGLEWLAAPGFVSVAEPYEVGQSFIRMERVPESTPTAEAASRFGANLARLHDAGAKGFGYTPSEGAFFGPLQAPIKLQPVCCDDFTEFWLTRCRQAAVLAAPGLDAVDVAEPDPEVAEYSASHPDPSAQDSLGSRIRAVTQSGSRRVENALGAIATGVFAGIAGGPPEPVARVHGDLWAGNLMWSGTDRRNTHAVLIDPAAHGGHPLEDLALLALFGAPYLDAIFTGYGVQRERTGRPLPADWQDDLPVHLFFALLAHVHLFGSAYTHRTVQVADSIVARAARLG